ncbi:MAG: EamA family transporter [Chthoniobacterales bacterium]
MKPPARLGLLAAFAGVYIIWGSTYLAILFAIQSMPPLVMAGARFLLAGAILYAIARISGAARSNLIEWRTAAIVGTCLLLGGNGGVTLSEQYIPSGLAALLVATVPLYTVLLMWLFRMGDRPTPLTGFGLAVGFVGVGVLVGPALHVSRGNESSAAWIGMVILLVSSLIWSLGSLYARKAQNARSSFLAASQQMLCGGGLMFLIGTARGELRHFHPDQISMVSLGAFAYLVLIGGILGYGSYAYLLKHCDPAKVATYAYVNPVVAVLLGALFAGEKLNLRTFVAAALIIGSVAIVITGGRKRHDEAERIAETMCPAD